LSRFLLEISEKVPKSLIERACNSFSELSIVVLGISVFHPKFRNP
jgi:hypothetical protein